MDFEDTEDRGYGYKSDQPRDIELKFCAKFLDLDSSSGLSISGPTGRHTDSGCCQGFAYMFSLEFEDPVRFRFRKEMYHVNYDDHPDGSFEHPLANFELDEVDRFLGFCYVRYNNKDGRGPGKDSVVIEGWYNPDPDADKNNWILLKRVEDKGGWGDGGDRCRGEDDQVGTWSNAVFRIKCSNSEIRYKNVSLREIDPNRSFDDAPETPEPGEEPASTTTLQGQFRFNWDVNTFRVSPCAGAGGGGGGGGSSLFYTVAADEDKELSDSSTYNRRIRVGQTVTNSSTPQSLYNKIVKQIDIPLKKSGSPGASPVVSAKIWNSSGSVVYTSPTTFDPSTFTTSFVKKTFDFSTNTHVMITGDRIGVEYTGTSSSNYVLCSYTDPSVASNSKYISFRNDGSGWDDVSSRDFSCDIWE